MRMRAIVAMGVAAMICAGCQHRAEKFAGVRDGVEQRLVESAANEYAERSSLTISKQMAGMALPAQVMAAGKYLEVKHRLTVQMKGAELGKSLEAVVTFCGTLQCELLSSNEATEEGDSVPSGSVAVRVAPGDLPKFLEFVGKQGKILTHATESQDRTTEIVDLEARMKNQTEFRDNLRKMLGRPGVKIEDLLQIQEKLAQAQAELDSEVANRKVLANETEKVAVEIEFRAEGGESRRGAFSAVGRAIRESGEVLAESLAALITAVAAILPWLIVIVPGGWLLRRVWKNWRKRRAIRLAEVKS